MQILYLSYDGMTDPLGQSQVLPYLVELTKLGHEFHLLSVEKEENLKDRQNIIAKLTESAHINWYHVHYGKSKSPFSKNANLKRLKKKAYEICSSHNIQFLHARSYMAALIAFDIKKKLRIPFIFDMRGFWADERIDGKIWNLKKPHHNIIYRYFKKKEIELLNESKQIISLTHSAKNYIVKTLNPKIGINKITVIPCCADLNLFKITERKNILLHQLNLNETNKILLYSGSVGTWYMLNEMIDFFKVFKNKFSDAVFLILTQNNHNIVNEAFLKNGIDKKYFRVVKVNREEMPDYIQLANVALYFIKPCFSKIASSPVKLAEFLGCGLTVFCNNGIGDIDEQAKDCNEIILVNNFTASAYENAISNYCNNSFSKLNAVNFAFATYSLQNGVKKYNEVYQSILNTLSIKKEDKI